MTRMIANISRMRIYSSEHKSYREWWYSTATMCIAVGYADKREDIKIRKITTCVYCCSDSSTSGGFGRQFSFSGYVTAAYRIRSSASIQRQRSVITSSGTMPTKPLLFLGFILALCVSIWNKETTFLVFIWLWSVNYSLIPAKWISKRSIFFFYDSIFETVYSSHSTLEQEKKNSHKLFFSTYGL